MVDEIAQLNAIRLNEDLSVATLADRIGIDASTLHRLLFRPERKPWDRTLFKIRKFLDARSATQSAKQLRKEKRTRRVSLEA